MLPGPRSTSAPSRCDGARRPGGGPPRSDRRRDLGYTFGRCRVRQRGTDGKVVEGGATYVTVWRRREDGHWKVALDTGTPDLR